MEILNNQPLKKNELQLLENMKQYIDLQPKKQIDVEAMAQFFKVSEEVIERIVVSKEGQVLIDKVVNYKPEPSGRGKVELLMKEDTSNPLAPSRIKDKDIEKKDEINSEFLARIALDKVTYEDALQAHAQSRTIDKMKLFQLQQAKSELLRVIRMMDTFNLLQDKYREQIALNIDMFEIDELVQHNKVAYDFIQQSMRIVDKFTNDDTLKILIMDSTVEQESDNIRDIVTGEDTLMSKANRVEIRKSAERLVAGLANIENEVTQPEPPKPSQNVKEAEIIKPELDEDIPLFEQLQKDNQFGGN